MCVRTGDYRSGSAGTPRHCFSGPQPSAARRNTSGAGAPAAEALPRRDSAAGGASAKANMRGALAQMAQMERAVGLSAGPGGSGQPGSPPNYFAAQSASAAGLQSGALSPQLSMGHVSKLVAGLVLSHVYPSEPYCREYKQHSRYQISQKNCSHESFTMAQM